MRAQPRYCEPIFFKFSVPTFSIMQTWSRTVVYFVYSGGSRSRHSRTNQHSPAHPPIVTVSPTPRRSMFRDAAAVAGGVTVGTTVGHLAGEAISSLFTGRHGAEVVQALPRNYDSNVEPSGPCAFEIAQFLQCATSHDNLQECQAFNEALRECKKRNRLP